MLWHRCEGRCAVSGLPFSDEVFLSALVKKIFEGDYLLGDFATFAEAMAAAREAAGTMNPAYVYDDCGQRLARFSTA